MAATLGGAVHAPMRTYAGTSLPAVRHQPGSRSIAAGSTPLKLGVDSQILPLEAEVIHLGARAPALQPGHQVSIGADWVTITELAAREVIGESTARYHREGLLEFAC